MACYYNVCVNVFIHGRIQSKLFPEFSLNRLLHLKANDLELVQPGKE